MRKPLVLALGLMAVAAWIAVACGEVDEQSPVRVADAISSEAEVFFPTWSSDIVPKGGVTGILFRLQMVAGSPVFHRPDGSVLEDRAPP
jgi:hypothetical protein